MILACVFLKSGGYILLDAGQWSTSFRCSNRTEGWAGPTARLYDFGRTEILNSGRLLVLTFKLDMAWPMVQSSGRPSFRLFFLAALLASILFTRHQLIHSIYSFSVTQ